MKAERLAVCKSLAESVTSALERIDQEDVSTNWRLRDIDRAGVLAGLAQALVATEQFELLSQLVTRALAAPKTYPLSAHIAALTTLGPWLKKNLKKPCEALTQWLTACCKQLEALTADEPAAPTDFRREANLSCKCAGLRGTQEVPAKPSRTSLSLSRPTGSA